MHTILSVCFWWAFLSCISYSFESVVNLGIPSIFHFKIAVRAKSNQCLIL